MVLKINIIAIYSRKSKFTDKGESLQNQVSLCREYGALHFTTNKFIIYEDEGFSGGNADRPQFKKMMQDAKTKKFDVLICYRLDRVSRNISDFTKLVELLQTHDITFVSIKEQFDTSTPMGRAMMYIALVFAQLERETIAERIRDNMLQLARTGRWLGGITPTGFKSESILYYDNHMNKKKMYRLTPIPKELDRVKIIFEKYLELDSLTQLESWCLENNLRTKNNKYYEGTALKLILSNPVYAVADEKLYEYFQNLEMDIASDKKDFDGKYGVLVYNKNQEKKGKSTRPKKYNDWIVAISKHPGIISSMDWIKVQYQLKKNSNKPPREGSSQIALLTPLLHCAHCGSKLKVTYKVKEGEVLHHYYKCSLKERSRGSLCKMNNLNGGLADEIVIREFKKLSISEKKLCSRLHIEKNRISKQIEIQGSKDELLNKRLYDCEKTISSLTLKLAESQESTVDKYIVKEIEKIHVEMNEIKKQLRLLRIDHEAIGLNNLHLEVAEDKFEDFPTFIDTADFNEKKLILQMVIKNIIWDGEQLKIIIKEV